LAVWSGGDDTDVGWVVDRCDDTSRENDLLPKSQRLVGVLEQQCGVNWDGDEAEKRRHRVLPCLSNIDHVDAIRTGLPQIWLHVYLQILRAEMALSSE